MSKLWVINTIIPRKGNEIKFSFKNLFILQLTLFIILLISWNIFTPILEGADEVSHFCHADYISHRNKLPNSKFMDGCFLWHPPLYYLSLVPVVKFFNLTEYPQNPLLSNPKVSLLRHAECAQFVHSKKELLFKWDYFQTQIHVLRFVSSIMAIGIFLITWKLSKTVFKDDKLRYLSLILFFNPMFIHIFTTLTNVVLVSFLATVFISVELFYVKREKPLKITFIQGILLGLGFLTKTNMLSLLFAYVFLFFTRWKSLKEKFIFKIEEATLFILGFLITSGWYILRSQKLYGQPFEFLILKHLDPASYHVTLLERVGLLNYWNSFFLTIFKTFWSGYGALTVNFPQIINIILLIFTLLIILSLTKSYKNLNESLKICVLYVFSVFGGLILVNLNFSAMHAKDLFPAYLPLSILFSFGLTKTIKLVKYKKISRLSYLFIFLTTAYFFAQQDIVRFIKLISLAVIKGSYNLQTAQSLLGISFIGLVKTVIVLVTLWLIKNYLRNVILSKRFLTKTTFIIFILNISILIGSTYLFYSKFI